METPGEKTPEQVITSLEQRAQNREKLAEAGAELIDKVLTEVYEKERDCLLRIFTRFCIYQKRTFNLQKVSVRDFPGRPNYCEYYYLQGTHQEYLLMTRELVNDAGNLKLIINFNPELSFNNEL